MIYGGHGCHRSFMMPSTIHHHHVAHHHPPSPYDHESWERSQDEDNIDMSALSASFKENKKITTMRIAQRKQRVSSGWSALSASSLSFCYSPCIFQIIFLKHEADSFKMTPNPL
jgi:hypothetical protein